MHKETNYYNQHAQAYYVNTVDVEMTPLYEKFLPLLSKGSVILDAGCGSGRDSKAFIELGFDVDAIDASETLGNLAARLIAKEVEITTFQAFKATKQYDAIWACASLLHVPMHELAQVFGNLTNCLKAHGIFYCSFKYGDAQMVRDGRLFSDLNEESLQQHLTNLPLTIEHTWITSDLRPGRETEQWLNAILIKGSQ